MLISTKYKIDPSIFKEACNQLPSGEMKTTINQSTGDFFYDSWVLKDEYKNTVWQNIYNSLPEIKGEARIIILDPGQCYQSHADIDDRFHLNIQEEQGYLIDLENNILHRLLTDGIWYEMDAGRLHTATNFGRCARIQLVVRKLLNDVKLKDPISIKIISEGYQKDHARFLFDNTVSAWLNRANKQGIIYGFKFSVNEVTFDIERSFLDDLNKILIDGFKIEKN